jgi:hypothetical protein
MTTTNNEKPNAKPPQRSQKASRRVQKTEPEQSPKRDQLDEDRISPMGASTDTPANGAPAPADTLSIDAAAPVDDCPVSIQTIANAYVDYTRTSLQESRSFVEKLMRARSFDNAIEVQTEFARQALANFAAGSQKICELYSKLATQMVRPWETWRPMWRKPAA